MYSYEPNTNTNEQNLTPTYSYQNYGGSYSTPTPPPPAPKKRSKAPRIVAAALGVALIAGGAGGGAAYMVVRNYTPDTATAAETAAANVGGTDIVAAAAGNQSSGGTADVSGVVAKAADSVVEIVTRTAGNPFTFQQTSEGAGSGVIITEDGYIVTNNHVVEGSQDITVLTSDGTEYEATLVGTDEKTDLAVIKIDATGLTAASYADSDSIQVGQLAVAIGNPLGELGGTVTSGIISATGREITVEGQTMNLLQTSAAVNPGNSGGGLFDENGNLVGVVNAKSYGINVEGLGFAIPSNTVREVAEDIIQNGYVTGRPQLGITVIEISDQYSMMMYRLNSMGVYIASDDNPQGLRAGDRIVSIDGEEIATSAQISAVLDRHAVGDTLAVAVERDGAEVRVDITLSERVPADVQQTQSEI